MRITRASLALFLVVMSSPASLSAQTGSRVRIVPHVGWSVPLNELGAVAPAGSAWYLRLGKMDATLALGTTVEVQWPSSRFNLRLAGAAALESEASGFFDCYPGLACPAVLLRGHADVRSLAATADLLYSPRGRGGLRPFAILGAGLRRYSFDWPAPPVLVAAGSHSETTPAVRAGLGLAADLLGGSFRVELTDLWSPVGQRIRPGGGAGQLSAPGRRGQHDLQVILGWALLRF
jgi:hypothetical protein